VVDKKNTKYAGMCAARGEEFHVFAASSHGHLFPETERQIRRISGHIGSKAAESLGRVSTAVLRGTAAALLNAERVAGIAPPTRSEYEAREARRLQLIATPAMQVVLQGSIDLADLHASLARDDEGEQFSRLLRNAAQSAGYLLRRQLDTDRAALRQAEVDARAALADAQYELAATLASQGARIAATAAADTAVRRELLDDIERAVANHTKSRSTAREFAARYAMRSTDFLRRVKLNTLAEFARIERDATVSALVARVDRAYSLQADEAVLLATRPLEEIRDTLLWAVGAQGEDPAEVAEICRRHGSTVDPPPLPPSATPRQSARSSDVT
jgi:hypothetical protein